MTIARIKSSYHHAFTLIELLVVISVIALLIPLLLPAMQGTCFAAKISQCESITRQLQLGRWMYGDDNDGKLIRHRGLPSDAWDGNNVTFIRKSAKDIYFFPYFDHAMQIFSCPDDWQVLVTIDYTRLGYAQLANMVFTILPRRAGWWRPQSTTIQPKPCGHISPIGWTAVRRPQIWPDWVRGSHPKVDYATNPDTDPSDRWVALLNDSERWDIFTLPDSDSKAMRRKILLQPGNGYFVSY